MSAASSLDTLIDLARRSRDDAGQALARERGQSRHTASQLETLRDYRQEYTRQLQTLLHSGTDATTLNNYQRFLNSLDAAIEQAQRTLSQQEQRVASSREQWQQQQRQLSSYDTLASRRNEQQRRREQRRELRLNDEFSNGISARRRQHPDERTL